MITNEIREKVFAQYWGQEVALTDDSKQILDYIQIAICDKLILKRLSAITNEDKLFIADLFGWLKEGLNINVRGFLCELRKTEYLLFPADKTLIAIQYLQSKGYDLPNYLLDGKTLQECGLAIYE